MPDGLAAVLYSLALILHQAASFVLSCIGFCFRFMLILVLGDRIAMIHLVIELLCSKWFWLGLSGLGCYNLYQLYCDEADSRRAHANFRQNFTTGTSYITQSTLRPTAKSFTPNPSTHASPSLSRLPNTSEPRSSLENYNTTHKASCGACYRNFAACDGLRQHQNEVNHHGIRCSCSETFITVSALEDHISGGSIKAVSVAVPKIAASPIEYKVPTCAVCSNYPHPMTATVCGHLFCRSCITQSIAIKEECPTCQNYAAVHELRDISL